MLQPELLDQLFATIRTTWGGQKFAASYGPSATDTRDAGEDWVEAVHALWSHQLSGFASETLKRALQAMIDSGREWPPTLPEFKAACRDFHRSVPVDNALPAPGQGSTDREAARAQLARIKAMLAGAVKVMP